MSLSNTATPKYYGQFREAVLRGEIPVCNTVGMEMERIDELIAHSGVYYDEDAVEGWIHFCEEELTLTDGSDLRLLDSFKLWGEQIFGWYYYVERSIFEPDGRGGGHYVNRMIVRRLINRQYLIVARGAAKSMYLSCIQLYFLVVYTKTTFQITTSPTMNQSDEVLSPIRTAIARKRGRLFKFLAEGSIQNTTGSRMNRPKLFSSKKGIENSISNSCLRVLPMNVSKLQTYRPMITTIDEWLSGDIQEDVVGAIVQGATKDDMEYLVIAVSSEGTVRNGAGDTTKMELMKILRGEYNDYHCSIWYYRLDDISEVNDPTMWVKANPNLGKTVQYDAYQADVERAEHSPSAKNDILAKRFGIPLEGYTHFFLYSETQPTTRKLDFWNMECALGADMSQGDDFCAFTFLFPLRNGQFGIKARSYITEYTLRKLPEALRVKYEEFIKEGTLIIMDGVVLEMEEVYEDVDAFIERNNYDVRSFGFDPYNAKAFVERWRTEKGDFGLMKVAQGARTETVPLGEIKKITEKGDLLFDESIMQFTMGNCVVQEDSNGNRKLLKKRREEKIDNVAAMMDAYISYKEFKEMFE